MGRSREDGALPAHDRRRWRDPVPARQRRGGHLDHVHRLCRRRHLRRRLRSDRAPRAARRGLRGRPGRRPGRRRPALGADHPQQLARAGLPDLEHPRPGADRRHGGAGRQPAEPARPALLHPDRLRGHVLSDGVGRVAERPHACELPRRRGRQRRRRGLHADVRGLARLHGTDEPLAGAQPRAPARAAGHGLAHRSAHRLPEPPRLRRARAHRARSRHSHRQALLADPARPRRLQGGQRPAGSRRR